MQPWAPRVGGLQPIPLVSVCFEWVGVDIKGPLPLFLLVMIDSAIWYPKAMLLCNIRTPSIVRELAVLFLRVCFPKRVIMDQGTDFMSNIFAQIWTFLVVQPLCISLSNKRLC